MFFRDTDRVQNIALRGLATFLSDEAILTMQEWVLGESEGKILLVIAPTSSEVRDNCDN